MVTFSAITGMAIMGGALVITLVGAAVADAFSLVTRKKPGCEHPIQ